MPDDLPGYNSLYTRQAYLNNMRCQTNLLFQYADAWMTVWLDEQAYAESFWEETTLASNQIVDQPVATDVHPQYPTTNPTPKRNRKKKSFFSFLKVLKK